MSPLLWLAIPVIATVAAALVVARRSDRHVPAPTPAQRALLLRRALTGPQRHGRTAGR